MKILERLEKLNKSRWIKFCLVGAIGTIPNYIGYMPFRHVEFNILLFKFNLGWGIGILCGMTSNYILNEVWTFFDR